jgi:hypothetical protein
MDTFPLMLALPKALPPLAPMLTASCPVWPLTTSVPVVAVILTVSAPVPELTTVRSNWLFLKVLAIVKVLPPRPPLTWMRLTSPSM